MKRNFLLIYNFIRTKYKMFLIGIAWFFSVAPLLLLSLYNHPSADDYNYSDTTHQVWLVTKSFLQVFIQAIKESVHNWNSWQGLYSSSILLSLQPAIYGERWYGLTGIMMIVTILIFNLVLSIYVLTYKIKIKKCYAIVAGLLSSFMMIQWMPDVNEGLFWFNGAVNYSTFYGFYIILLCGIISILVNQKENYAIWKLVFICFIGFFLEGGNHVTAFLGLEVIGIAIIITILLKSKKKIIYTCIIFFVMLSGFVFNITSPGTRIRETALAQEGVESLGSVKTIYLSIANGMNQMSEWLTGDFLIFLLISLPFIIFLSYSIINYTKYQFSNPIFVLIISLGLHCSMLCPPLYAMGTVGNGRLINIVFYNFVLTIYFNLIYLTCFAIRCFELNAMQEHIISVFTNKKIKITFISIELCLILFWSVEYYPNLNGYKAMNILESGEVQKYSEECNRRDLYLRENKDEEVVISGLSVEPEMIFRTDITEDPTDWKNNGVARYYNLESIRIQ